MADRTCSLEDCNVDVWARGMCQRHYANLTRYGHAIPIREWPLIDRLNLIGWEVTPTGCWEWRGPRNEFGYGLFNATAHGYRDGRAHRAMVEATSGKIPDGLLVRHKCDNPPCVNPAHLELGTDADNSADMVERGRHWMHGRTECPNGHDVTEPGALKLVTQKRRKPYYTCIRCEANRKMRFEQRKRASLAAQTTI